MGITPEKRCNIFPRTPASLSLIFVALLPHFRKTTKRSRMHLCFVIQGLFAFRQDTELGSCLVMIYKKKKTEMSVRTKLATTLPCQFAKQLCKGIECNDWTRMDSVMNKEQFCCGGGLEKRHKCVNAETCLQYAVL